MQVILLERVRNLGALGEEVNVRPGYARNYLIPQGKAVMATVRSRTEFEARRAELEKAAADSLASARARATALDGATIQLVRRAGEEGKLFGSVSPGDIAEAAEAAGFEVSRAEIDLGEGPIKTVGDHEVEVALHPEVRAKIIVSVIAES
jgi:large subunit ribosomal protein L9